MNLLDLQQCLNEGEIITSIFIQDDGWYTPELIEQMFYYYMTQNAPLDDSARKELESKLNEEYLTKENVELYENYFKSAFELTLREGFSAFMCSSNQSIKSNTCIAFTGREFRFLLLPNSEIGCTQMNETLDECGHSGNYCHVIVTKK